MTNFGTSRDKKSHDYDVEKKAKDHAVSLSGAFRRVNDKLCLRKIPDYRPGILPIHRDVQPGRVKKGYIKNN